jgi:5'-3' exonuclease
MGSPIAMVDLSWAAYTFRRSYKDVVRVDADGRAWPAGHVYGCIKVIRELSYQNKVVLLAIDSVSPWRYEAVPGYKSGRHQPTGDPFEDYKIMTDLLNILKLCTYQKNVFYVKHSEMEADDLLASVIFSSVSDDKKEWSLYFNDNDVLQSDGKYVWFPRFGSPPVDRREYIKEKYGIDLEYLPVWYKVIRGDASDHIPVAIPRLSSSVLVKLCGDLKGSRDFKDLVLWLRGANLSKAFLWVKEQINDEESDLYTRLEANWRVIVPRVVGMDAFRFKRFETSLDELQRLLEYYQIRDYQVW